MSAWPEAVWITKKVNNVLQSALHFKEWLDQNGNNKTIVDQVFSDSNFKPKVETQFGERSVWLVIREKGV